MGHSSMMDKKSAEVAEKLGNLDRHETFRSAVLADRGTNLLNCGSFEVHGQPRELMYCC